MTRRHREHARRVRSPKMPEAEFARVDMIMEDRIDRLMEQWSDAVFEVVFRLRPHPNAVSAMTTVCLAARRGRTAELHAH